MPVQNLPFIENMEKRIQNASLTVDASLGHCFADGLEHRDATAIYNCLRAYAAIDNTNNAEEIFRINVVAPLIQKIIPHGPSAVVAGSFGDGLENDYQLIKECINKDCKFLLEISSAGTFSDFFSLLHENKMGPFGYYLSTFTIYMSLNLSYLFLGSYHINSGRGIP